MKPLAAALLMVISLAAACTAPGEPPEHPSRQDYRDLIRREVTDTTSALATARLAVIYLGQDRITRNYALTIVHQTTADLDRITTDLTQIHPPTPYVTPQHKLRTLTSGAAHDLSRLPRTWSAPDALTTVITILTRDINSATSLTDQLPT
jgi:hypothetical protein